MDRKHQDQFGVGDPLASESQRASRNDGIYDPRPASGQLVGRRVRLRCGRCGKLLGHVDEYEQRLLFHSVRDARWSVRVQGLKCRDCFRPLEPFEVDLDAVLKAVEKARATTRVCSLKIGALVG